MLVLFVSFYSLISSTVFEFKVQSQNLHSTVFWLSWLCSSISKMGLNFLERHSWRMYTGVQCFSWSPTSSLPWSLHVSRWIRSVHSLQEPDIIIEAPGLAVRLSLLTVLQVQTFSYVDTTYSQLQFEKALWVHISVTQQMFNKGRWAFKNYHLWN